MAKKHIKKMLTIPSHKGNAYQNTLRFHLTPARKQLSSKTPLTTSVGKNVGKRNPHTLR
jgi:hypothetical protein